MSRSGRSHRIIIIAMGHRDSPDRTTLRKLLFQQGKRY